MPFIKIMNLSAEKAAVVAENAVGEIARATGINESAFNWFNCGELIKCKETAPLVFVEVEWYARNETQMQKVAAILSGEVKKHGDYVVSVVFQDMKAGNHYTDGVKFKPPVNNS